MLVTDFILTLFGRNPSEAKNAYRDFVETIMTEKYESPLKDVLASTVLGSEGFIQYIKEKYLVSAKSDRNVPALTELSTKKTITEIRRAVDGVFSEDPQAARKAAIYVCHRYSGRRLKEIGACFGVGESAVSQTSGRLILLM